MTYIIAVTLISCVLFEDGNGLFYIANGPCSVATRVAREKDGTNGSKPSRKLLHGK